MSSWRSRIELLVLRAQAGDVEAFSAIVELWHAAMVRHARRFSGDDSLATDATQDAWCTIVRELRRLDDPARFVSWALRIVQRRAVDLLRKRRVAIQNDEHVVDAHAGSAASIAEHNEEHRRLLEAVRLLDVDHRVTVELHYLEQLTLAEVSEVLELPLGTVKSRLFHARKRLRAALESRQNVGNQLDEKP